MKKILKDGLIELLIPDSEKGGMSKETHLVRFKKKKYVLRICKNKQIADYYSSICRKFSKYEFLPKLIRQDGRRLLFEYIEGRDCKKNDALKVAYSIGRIVGIINKTGISKEERINSDKNFFDNLDIIKTNKIIDEKTYEQIKEKYKKLRRMEKIKVSLDANDVIPSNFRINNGTVYLVDIEMIRPSIKSKGIAKSFLKWFVTEKQREGFKRGYNSVNSAVFLTKDYLQLIYLYFLVTNMKTKIYNGLSNQGNKMKLNKLLKGKLK